MMRLLGLARLPDRLPPTELDVAKEILGEVFNTTLEDVDEMLRSRMGEEAGQPHDGSI
jgi:hypothetical protein